MTSDPGTGDGRDEDPDDDGSTENADIELLDSIEEELDEVERSLARLDDET
ncbi:MAG: hypothetical protein ACRDV4_08875 [Acidimicrobiales bacterium]